MQNQKTESHQIDASDLPDLTPQQSEFVRHILSGKSASDAYRAAYDCSASLPSTIWARASELRSNGKVAAWLAAARKANLGSATLTREQHMQELERIREIALESGNIGAAALAETNRGKAAGLYVERFEDVTTLDPVQTLASIALHSPELALKLAQDNNIALAMPADVMSTDKPALDRMN